MDGDWKVMVPWMRGIDRRWSVATEFCRRAGAALSWLGKKKKGRGPPLLRWRGECGEEKSSSSGERGDEESSGGERNHQRRERQARRARGKEKERDERLTGGAHYGKPPPHSVGGDLSGFES